jgi:hypothetical protein
MLRLKKSINVIAAASVTLLLLVSHAKADDEIRLDSPIKDKWAVVVGISSFANPSMNLKYAAKDAADFKEFLVNKCHFAPDHIKLLTNEKATKDKILDVLGDSWLPRLAMPEDLVVIYVSSHGSPSSLDVAGVNYVVAHDTNPDKLFTTGIPIQHLSDTIKERVHSKRVLIILDACHSGAASDSQKGLTRTGNVDAAQIAQGTGHAVICSSAKNESSWEAKNAPNGVFTKALIEAFQTKGEATKLSEAFSSLKDKVQRQVITERGVTQTPVLEVSKWKGQELLLAAVPTDPRPAPNIPDDTDAPVKPEKPMQIATKSLPPNTIPDITGRWLGSNGFVYTYWQKGKACGWDMPQYGVSGRCMISSDGKTMMSTWGGTISGSCTSTLEVDEYGRLIRIVSDNGVILTRMDPLPPPQ